MNENFAPLRYSVDTIESIMELNLLPTYSMVCNEKEDTNHTAAIVGFSMGFAVVSGTN